MPKTLPKRVCDNDAKTASDFLTEIPCLIVKVKFEPKWNSFVLPNVMPNICTFVNCHFYSFTVNFICTKNNAVLATYLRLLEVICISCTISAFMIFSA